MFEPQDLLVIVFLIFLEGILSVDNALVLALIAKNLPKNQQKKALTYGLIGAFFFRFIAIGLAAYLIHWYWVKFVGGGYLIWLSVKYFLFEQRPHEEFSTKPSTPNQISFWKAVCIIELTDIAFAIDSILAAVALTQKFWIVFTGGILGVILMRFAASGFIKLLERFPRFASTAYFLVLIIGLKLVLEGFKIPGIDFHSTKNPFFWLFWVLMLGSIFYGFRRPKIKSR